MSIEFVPMVSAVLTVATAIGAPATAAAPSSTGPTLRAANVPGTSPRSANSSAAALRSANASAAALRSANASSTTLRSANASTAALKSADVPASALKSPSVWGTTVRGASLTGTTGVTKPELTAEQKLALKHLHETAQQFESLFVNMLFKSMREAAPQTSITGEKQSPAETTFTEMLDEKRSESMAQTGAFGLAKVLEDQLKASVLANPAQAAKSRVAPEGIL